MLNMLKNNKLLVYVLVLAIIAVIGIVILVSLSQTSGQGVYAGVNIQKTLELGEYKNMTWQFTADTTEATMKRNILNNIVIDSQIEKYPKKALKKYTQENMEYYEGVAKDYGYETLEQYVTEKFQYTLEEFEVYIEEYAKSRIKSELVVYAIAEAEGMEVTDKDVEQYCKDLLEQEGFTEESFMELYGMTIQTYAKENNFRFNLLQEQVLTFLYENSTIETI